MITSFSDPEVPQGGTLRERVGFELSVPGGDTHTFTFLVLIGTGSTKEAILGSHFDPAVFGHHTQIPSGSGSFGTNFDMGVPSDLPTGTYSVLTVICEDFDGTTITGEWDFKVDANIVTIVKGLGAEITWTIFDSI